jgi:hypothetical protein
MRKEPHLVENTVIWDFGFGGYSTTLQDNQNIGT